MPGLGASARRAIASNATPPKRASAMKSFAARTKPVSSGSLKTKPDDAFPAANRRRLRQSRALARLRPALPRRERSLEPLALLEPLPPLAAQRKSGGSSLGVRRSRCRLGRRSSSRRRGRRAPASSATVAA